MESEEGEKLVQSNIGTNTTKKKKKIATSPPSHVSKLELTVDEVIEEYVGLFGLSQLVHAFLVSLVCQNTLATIFTDAQPSSGGARILPNPGPRSGSGDVTAIAEWGLVCDRRFLAVVPALLFFLGSSIGLAANGHIVDAWLRRKRTAWLFLTSFSPNVVVDAFLRFANGWRMVLIKLSAFGVQLNFKNLSFNLYFTATLNAMMEISAVFIGGILLGFMNRN
ncbi:hypothetical protein MLD38_032874 [Melastoma candidum]|uniref:Uncharacterized protein n=1 Tax=Melastoma candidum TaxID=119954 RepID=A0ACB9M994_9MYRT|nr:hypothetical protein MLD38_032874 [Melastoma candidum]